MVVVVFCGGVALQGTQTPFGNPVSLSLSFALSLWFLPISCVSSCLALVSFYQLSPVVVVFFVAVVAAFLLR